MTKRQAPHRDLYAVRVACFWKGSLQREITLRSRQPLIIGDHKFSVFPLSEGLLDDYWILLEPKTGGDYTIRLHDMMTGHIRSGGVRQSLRKIAMQEGEVHLRPRDQGMIHIGDLAFFLDYGLRAPSPKRKQVNFSGAAWSGFLLSLVVHAALLIYLHKSHADMPPSLGRELSTELIGKYLVVPTPRALIEATQRQKRPTALTSDSHLGLGMLHLSNSAFGRRLGLERPGVPDVVSKGNETLPGSVDAEDRDNELLGSRRDPGLRVRTGAATTNGFLSQEQIDRVVRARRDAISDCFEVHAQQQPKLKGRIDVILRVNLAGQVSRAVVGNSTMKNPRVESCIVRQVRTWQFPRPDGGECVISYPFFFGVRNAQQ